MMDMMGFGPVMVWYGAKQGTNVTNYGTSFIAA
jgi:hypothetical protein